MADKQITLSKLGAAFLGSLTLISSFASPGIVQSMPKPSFSLAGAGLEIAIAPADAQFAAHNKQIFHPLSAWNEPQTVTHMNTRRDEPKPVIAHIRRLIAGLEAGYDHPPRAAS